jgi:hypothetical protein
MAPQTWVQLNGVNIYAETPARSPWSLDWLREYAVVWPEDQEKIVAYSVDRDEFEKVKYQPLHLRVELALTEYRAADTRKLQVVSDRLSDRALGTCRISSINDSRVRCLYPVRAPAYVVRFDPGKSGCLDDENAGWAQANVVSYAWQSSNELGFPDPGLNPISDYVLSFSSVSPAKPSQTESETSQPGRARFREVRLCPGTVLTLSRPVLQRQFRIQLDLPNTRLNDLADSPVRLQWR